MTAFLGRPTLEASPVCVKVTSPGNHEHCKNIDFDLNELQLHHKNDLAKVV